MCENLFIYVAEQTEGPCISIRDEIKKAELEELDQTLSFIKFYNSMTMIRDIVVENGMDFKFYVSPSNLAKLKSNNITPEKMTLNANKLVLNYASSIKTYIDMETRILSKHKTIKEQNSFIDICHTFYDNHVEYRFWANFRNYVVHCEFPYSKYSESLDSGVRIICSKDHLLKFENWKHSKNDIMQMNDEIDLPSLVDNMSGLVMALYIDFFTYFVNEIVNAVQAYDEFCRRYNVNSPIIVKTKDQHLLENGTFLQPLPIKELREAFNVLKSNPHVKVNVK